MTQDRILCLDLGAARIGVAVSDPLGLTAQAVEVIKTNEGNYIDRVKELANFYDVKKLLIGHPINKDGSEGAKALAVREQSEYISQETGLVVELWDERFSTKEAQHILEYENINQKKQKNVVDMLAAQIILQGYLDAIYIKNTQHKKKAMKGTKTMDDKILLINEEGEEIEFIIDDRFEFDGKTYVVLCEEEDSDDALLFKIEEDEDGDVTLLEVDDDEEFEKVSEFYFEN